MIWKQRTRDAVRLSGPAWAANEALSHGYDQSSAAAYRAVPLQEVLSLLQHGSWRTAPETDVSQAFCVWASRDGVTAPLMAAWLQALPDDLPGADTLFADLLMEAVFTHHAAPATLATLFPDLLAPLSGPLPESRYLGRVRLAIAKDLALQDLGDDQWRTCFDRIIRDVASRLGVTDDTREEPLSLLEVLLLCGLLPSLTSGDIPSLANRVVVPCITETTDADHPVAILIRDAVIAFRVAGQLVRSLWGGASDDQRLWLLEQPHFLSGPWAREQQFLADAVTAMAVSTSVWQSSCEQLRVVIRHAIGAVPPDLWLRAVCNLCPLDYDEESVHGERRGLIEGWIDSGSASFPGHAVAPLLSAPSSRDRAWAIQVLPAWTTPGGGDD